LSAVGEIDDRLGSGLNHRVDLLDLLLGVGTGDLDLEIDLVRQIGMGRHGLDHVAGFGLPVIADIAHAQEDLVLFLSGNAGRSSQQAQASHSGQQLLVERQMSPPMVSRLPVPSTGAVTAAA
jgi:hypothetical protein